jgi:hypothetical protein
MQMWDGSTVAIRMYQGKNVVLSNIKKRAQVGLSKTEENL